MAVQNLIFIRFSSFEKNQKTFSAYFFYRLQKSVSKAFWLNSNKVISNFVFDPRNSIFVFQALIIGRFRHDPKVQRLVNFFFWPTLLMETFHCRFNFFRDCILLFISLKCSVSLWGHFSYDLNQLKLKHIFSYELENFLLKLTFFIETNFFH